MINFHAIAPNGQPEKYQVKLAGEALDFCAAAAVGARGRIYRKPWVEYLVTDPALGTVGGCGFKAMPVNDRVEIFYSCFSGFAGCGYEGAMLRALAMVVSRAAPQLRLMLHSAPVESEATTILEQAGFHYVGMVEHSENGLVWLWEREMVV